MGPIRDVGAETLGLTGREVDLVRRALTANVRHSSLSTDIRPYPV
jgi:hypothetical protein